jgi:hypothetical protein
MEVTIINCVHMRFGVQRLTILTSNGAVPRPIHHEILEQKKLKGEKF